MAKSVRRAYLRLPTPQQCGVCHQEIMQRFAMNIWGGGIILNFCPDCDTGHCYRCRAHPVDTAARACVQCGATLDLRAGTTSQDERLLSG